MGWDDCFDFVHFEFTQPDTKAKEIRRVLREGGRLVCCSWHGQEDLAWPVDLFFRFDPLILAAQFLTFSPLVAGLFWSLVMVALTFILGRFFCGWVCPLGTTLDGARRLLLTPRPDRGVAARWRRGKYYLLVGLLWIFSRPPRPLGAALVAKAGGGPSPAALMPLFLFAALYLGTEQALGGWLFTYGRQSAALDASAASLLTALFWLSMVAGRLAAIGILGRVGNLVLLLGGVLLGAAGIVVLVLGSRFLPLLWLGTIVTGFGFGPLFPTTLALGAQLAPARAGAVSSLVVASGLIGVMVLPYASGGVMARVGVVESMASLVVPLVAMLFCLRRLGRPDKQVKSRVGN